VKWYDRKLLRPKFAHALMATVCLVQAIRLFVYGQLMGGCGWIWVLIIYADNVKLNGRLEESRTLLGRIVKRID
jgi:hypothetical protein